MSILVDRGTTCLVQGITGKEGSRAAKEMLAYGTLVAAGVTPGKGGTTTEDGIPVFHSVAEALRTFPEISATLITVPAPFVADAAQEAIWNKIPLLDILTEKVPVFQVASILAYAKAQGVQVVGPSSVGILSPGKGKIGSIGSSELVHTLFSQGPVGVISKSGGMTAEISRILTAADLGQSTVIGIGGDVLVGSDFVDMARLFEQDEDTKVLVVFGELGGTYEELLADAMQRKEITKPVIALIAGSFAEKLPHETVLGHAGAIVNKDKGSARSKIEALQQAGAFIADTPEDIPFLARQALHA